MYSAVTLEWIEITAPVRVILCFGPAAPTTGTAAGAFYEAVIDPNMKSPGGEFLRFDQRFQGGEVHGWQRASALTVCEVLGAVAYKETPPEGYTVDAEAKIGMQAVKSWR